MALTDIAAEQARILGDGNPDLLLTRQYLGHATGAAGNPLEGAAMLRKLLAEQTRLQGEFDAAHRALAQAQTETAAAQKQFETLQGQINAAAAELNAL